MGIDDYSTDIEVAHVEISNTLWEVFTPKQIPPVPIWVQPVASL